MSVPGMGTMVGPAVEVFAGAKALSWRFNIGMDVLRIELAWCWWSRGKFETGFEISPLGRSAADAVSMASFSSSDVNKGILYPHHE